MNTRALRTLPREKYDRTFDRTFFSGILTQILCYYLAQKYMLIRE